MDQFERMRWLFQTMFPKANVDPALPIVVVAAGNEKSFQALEPAAYPARGQLWLGGLFLRTPDKYYVLLRLGAEEEHPFATVYHEYTHLEFSGDSEWMPLWLNEGTAEFIQNTEFSGKNVQIGEPSGDDILYLRRQHQLIPLPVLFKVDYNSPYYHEEQKGSVFYAESWALIHYLTITDKEKGTDKVGNYSALLMQHEDPVAAAEKAFGDLKKLQFELEDYIRDGHYKHLVLSSAAAPIDESSFKVKILTQTESDAARADVLASVQRVQEARDLLSEVLKADPNNVQAHETMGSIEFRNGHLDVARKWYEDAVKLDPQDYLAHYYFAALSIGQRDSEMDKEIEASLQTAIRLNPRFAPAYDRLATFYESRRENLDKAHMLNVYAVNLDPGNLGYRVNAANVLIAMERYSDAERVLQVSLKMTKNQGETAMVQSYITRLEQIQAAREQPNLSTTAQGDVQVPEQVIAVDQGLKHPTEPTDGPKHEALGVIRGVQCSYPAVIEFKVENVKKTVSLYNNNYYELEFSALGFTPEGDLNPCKGIEGMKARVQYTESSDKTVDGQAIAVELRK
ncbi:MAG: tetratricopeptide repeat protein [Terracidiphilus sp.]|jgi:tetratricopeptide (TPR) repeat protein